MATATTTPLEALKKRKQEMGKNPCRDKRKAKGDNQYTAVVLSCYEVIEELIGKGDTLNGIFRDLQDKEFFDSKADLSPFWRAFHRERRRRGSAVAGSKGDVFPQRAAVLPVKNHVPVSSPKASLQGTLIDKNDKNAPVGGKYMRNGKYFAVDLAGEEVEIPPGFDFIRNKLRRIEFEPEKEEDDDALSFKDYPEYIQTALLESEKNGTITEDAEKNRKLVADWKKQRKTKTRKESQENEA